MAIASKVAGNHAIRKIGVILSNGHKAYAQNRFPVHEGLMGYFRKMYDEAVSQKQQELVATTSSSKKSGKRAAPQVDVSNTFLNYLENYLMQAVGNVMQSATKEEIPALLAEVRQLMDDTKDGGGTLPVIQQLLIYEKASFD